MSYKNIRYGKGKEIIADVCIENAPATYRVSSED
jgi:hypothetical protein